MVDDVRNGILMDPRLHRYFDRYFFTIYRNEDVFTVKVGEVAYPQDAEFANLDGLVVTFGLDRGLWPHAEFLKFHNRNFEFFQKKMEAEAEPKEFDRQNTDSTMIHDFVAIESSKLNWIVEQRNVLKYEDFKEDIEINIET